MDTTKRKALPPGRARFIGAVLSLGATLAMPSWAGSFFFTTGTPDGKAGALSRPASPGKIETETADDFFLTQTTVIRGATINGLLAARTPLANITNVEVEIYHLFPLDSGAFDERVPTRNNSPSDVEIGSATRDGRTGGLSFAPSQVSPNFIVTNSVVNNIKTFPDIIATGGDLAMGGQEIEITITFTKPIVLPAGHYFFRPEVDVTSDNFLFISAPRPIVAPGTPVAGDLQAWIRNSNTRPDWLRIGTDVIGGVTPPTFNMAFSLTGETIPEAGTPGSADCHGKTISATAKEFGGLASAASALGFASVDSLQEAFQGFCEP